MNTYVKNDVIKMMKIWGSTIAHVIMNKHTHVCTHIHTHLFNLQQPRPFKHYGALPRRSCDQNCAYNADACCDCPTPHPLLLSWCFTATETIRLIKDGERVGGRWRGGQVEMTNSPKCPGPQRMKRSSATARTATLRRWGPRQYEATCVLR